MVTWGGWKSENGTSVDARDGFPEALNTFLSSERAIFLSALEAFLASEEFENVVHDDFARFPVFPRVVQLYGEGTFTVFSRREDDSLSPDAVVVENPARDARRGAMTVCAGRSVDDIRCGVARDRHRLAITSYQVVVKDQQRICLSNRTTQRAPDTDRQVI